MPRYIPESFLIIKRVDFYYLKFYSHLCRARLFDVKHSENLKREWSFDVQKGSVGWLFLASYFTQEGPTEDKDNEFLDDDKVDDIPQENELPDSNNYNETPDVNDSIENLQSKPRKKIKPGYFEHFEQRSLSPFPMNCQSLLWVKKT